MSQPLDDIEIMNDTVKDNGNMTYTLLDGHKITAATAGEALTADEVIAWCNNVRGIAMAREAAKVEEAQEQKTAQEIPYDPSSPHDPIKWIEVQIKKSAQEHTRVQEGLQDAMDEVTRMTQLLHDLEVAERQWQAILESLDTDAEARLSKSRDET